MLRRLKTDYLDIQRVQARQAGGHTDYYEVVGVVEPDAEWHKKRGNDPAYRGLHRPFDTIAAAAQQSSRMGNQDDNQDENDFHTSARSIRRDLPPTHRVHHGR